MSKQYEFPIPMRVPFMIELAGDGRYMTAPISFRYGFKKLEYKYLCKAEEGRIMCFRFASDARLTAKHNDWVYLGKSK